MQLPLRLYEEPISGTIFFAYIRTVVHPIASDGKQFYLEGFVVRFYRWDASEWVANFEVTAP